MFPQPFKNYLDEAYLNYYLNFPYLAPPPSISSTRPQIPVYNPLDSLRQCTTSQPPALTGPSYITELPEEKEQLNCDYCKFTCNSLRSMTRHHKEKHNSAYTVLTCGECTFTTVYQIEMNEHIANQHVKLLSCCICNQQFYGKQLLAQHFQNHFQSGHYHLATELAMAQNPRKGCGKRVATDNFPAKLPRLAKNPQDTKTVQNPKAAPIIVKEVRKSGKETWDCPICNFHTLNELKLQEHVQKTHLADPSCSVVGIRSISAD